MVSPAWRWKVTYSKIEDLDRGRLKTYDGEVHLWRPNNVRKEWITLKNAKGMAIKGKNFDEDMILIGSEVRFPGYYVTIVSCMHAPVDSDGSGNYIIINSEKNHRIDSP